MIGLVDCNNFFVSCELTRHPELIGRPTVVGGRNGGAGGCVVAMSNEAKAIGIKRGAPLFKIRDLIERHGVVNLECDHRFYRDISAKVMTVIASLVDHYEIYSVDEAFIHIPFTAEHAREFAHFVAENIKERTGIPVSIGLSTTKTLAKIATHFAKHHRGYRGVCLMDTPEKIRKGLELTPIGDVWGVGRRLRPRFERVGLRSAAEFADLDRERIERSFSLPLLRTWQELNSVPVLDESTHSRTYSTTSHTRTFAHDYYNLETIAPLVSKYAESVSAELRRHSRLAVCIEVFLDTNRFKPSKPQRHASDRTTLAEPTDDTFVIVAAASQLLKKIFAPGYGYKRAGVIISKTIPAESRQQSLFADHERDERRRRLMKTLDQINANGAVVKVAATGDEPPEPSA